MFPATASGCAWTWTGTTETGERLDRADRRFKAPDRLTEGQDHFYVRSLSQDGSKLILAQSIGGNEHDRLFILDRESRWLTPLTPLQRPELCLRRRADRGRFDPGLHRGFRGRRRSRPKAAGSRKQDMATGRRTVLARTTSVCDMAPRAFAG